MGARGRRSSVPTTLRRHVDRSETLQERPCRLVSDRSTGMYRGKLRAVLDRAKLRGVEEMLNGRGLVPDEQA